MPLLAGFAFGSGGGIPLATVTSTTGSPTVDTTSRPGKTIYTFNGSGTIVFGVAGTCEVLAVGGGGAGFNSGGGISYGNGGGGAGGYVYNASALVAAATFTVTIGAGGTTGGQMGSFGRPTQLANSSNSIVFACSGGGKGTDSGTDLWGAQGMSSPGRAGNAANAALAVTTSPFIQGNTGGSTPAGSSNGGSGGGGSSGVGSNSTTSNGATGGVGTSNSITGTAVFRGGGGGGGGGNTNAGGAGGNGGGGAGGTGNASNGTAGTANRGGGGGGGGANYSGANGGSGQLIVVVG
jgi:hypothetical protein